MTPPPNEPLRPGLARDDYARVAHAFVELRGRGLGLASADLEILRSWRDQALPAPALLEFLLGMAEECELEERGFPVTLKAIDTRLRRALREGRLALAPPDGTLGLVDPESAGDPGCAPSALPAEPPPIESVTARADTRVASTEPAPAAAGLATERAFERAGLPPPQRD